MASDIISILDHESIENVIGVGHDWGTYLLSQLIIWYPERIERCVFVSVPFGVPGRKTDAKALNEKSREALGFETLGYWMFLTDPKAGKEIGDNVSAGFFLSHPFSSFDFDFAFDFDVSIGGAPRVDNFRMVEQFSACDCMICTKCKASGIEEN